jgi:hypothetical protein
LKGIVYGVRSQRGGVYTLLLGHNQGLHGIARTGSVAIT